MTAKNKRPPGGRAFEISWGDCSQSIAPMPVHYWAGPFITTSTYQWWEYLRYILETETPGRFGTYGKEAQ